MVHSWRLITITFVLFGLALTSSTHAEKMTLQQCLERALIQSKRIQMEEAKVQAAEAKVKEAFGGFLPQVNVNATYTYSPWLPKSVFNIELPEEANGVESAQTGGEPTQQPNQEGTEPTDQQPTGEQPPAEGGTPTGGLPFPSGPVEVEFGASHNGMVMATLQQPLFTWGKLRNALSQAEASLEAAKQGLEAARQQLRLEVTEAFYGTLLAQEFVAVSERALEQVQKHRDLAALLVDNGTATKYDLLRAEVQLANVRAQWIRAKNALDLAKENLKLLLSMGPDQAIEVEGHFDVPSEERSLVSLTERALHQRPDLQQLAFQEQAGQKLVRIAKAANKPNLALASNYQYQISDRQTSGNHSFNVSLALQFPLFDGFKTRAQVHQAESGLEQIQLGREQLEDGIRLEVKATYLNLQQAQALIEAQQETVAQAKEGLRIANLQYENGMITSVELTDAELALTQAEVNQLQAMHDYAVAYARLEKAIGKPVQLP